MEQNKYDNWHALRIQDEELNSPWHSSIIHHINSENDIRGKRILEIACGRGAFSNYLASQAEKPVELFACDYSQVALDIAKSRYGDHNDLIAWKAEDIHKMSFTDSYFDVVISCETIEHLNAPAEAIVELYRVLKPGGKLFLTFPNYFNPFGLWCFYRWLIRKPYTEGGQAYVSYTLTPRVYLWLKRAGFYVTLFHSSDLVVPIWVHLHFFRKKLFSIFRILGLQTFYILRKPQV